MGNQCCADERVQDGRFVHDNNRVSLESQRFSLKMRSNFEEDEILKHRPVKGRPLG